MISRRSLLACTPAVLACFASVACRGGRSGPGRTAPADDVASFLAAVDAGDEPEVRARLRARPELASARDGAGVSALLHAHLAGHLAVARALREHGLALDLAECVFEADWQRLDELARADPRAPLALHPLGGDLLHAGALAGSGELYRLRALGCPPDSAPPGGSGFTPARAAMNQRTLEGAVIAATDLLGNGSSANARQKGGDSVLHGAVRRRSARLVRLAVRKGADVRARDDAGRTALDLARELRWDEGARLLADEHRLPRDHRASRLAWDASGAKVVIPDLSDVPQALQNRVTGASHANLAALRELVASDRRLVFSVSTDAELAIEACAHVGNAEILRFHLDHGAPLALPSAVALGDARAATRMLDADPLLVHERGAHDFPVMHYAAIGAGGIELAELLHARGADVDQETQGLTALHWSVRRDRIELTRWLLEHGADPRAVALKWDARGETPLDVARKAGLARQVELLEA